MMPVCIINQRHRLSCTIWIARANNAFRALERPSRGGLPQLYRARRRAFHLKRLLSQLHSTKLRYDARGSITSSGNRLAICGMGASADT